MCATLASLNLNVTLPAWHNKSKIGVSNATLPSSIKHITPTDVIVLDTLPQNVKQSGVNTDTFGSVIERTP